MSKLTDGMKTKTGRTANWAVTHTSSLDGCLDLFFLAWASRNMSEKDIIALFSKAFAEDKNTALKVLFWARDVRGWAGERRFFRIVFKYLAVNNKLNDLNDFFSYVVKYGRWDDLFFDAEITKFTKRWIRDIVRNNNAEGIGLLYKWMPREKSANKDVAKILRKELSLSSADYRKLVAKNSSTIEQLISENKWWDVKYESVPSKAFSQYRKAFYRNDETRFESFLLSVEKWEATVNAGAIFPVDIYKSWEANWDNRSINAQWGALPDFLEWSEENIMPVCDTSGSMWWEPIRVSVSLWVYLSERTRGIFRDHFITFEGRPKLQSVSWTATDRFNQIRNTNSDCSTNLQGVFDLLLDIAQRDGLKQEDLPTKMMIISDMEFNHIDGWYFGNREKTNFELIREKFEKAGYKMPWLIFWNVNGRLENSPAQKTDKDVALVSGYSPSIVKSILGWEDLSPIGVMNKTLETYNFVDSLI